MADITRLCYERINHRFSYAEYGEFKVVMDNDGYINATKLCELGGKQYKHWSRNDGPQDLIAYFSERLTEVHGEGFEISRVVVGGQISEVRGTYLHYDLIPHVASWVSSSFAWKVSKIVNEYLENEKDEKIKSLEKTNYDLMSKMNELMLQTQSMMQQIKTANLKTHQELKNVRNDNVKTHVELRKVEDDNITTHETLDRVSLDLAETKQTAKQIHNRLCKTLDVAVPPAIPTKVQELFLLFNLNDPDARSPYKVCCLQKQSIKSSVRRLLLNHPQAVKILEISYTPNSKNLLHRLKDRSDEGSGVRIVGNYLLVEDNMTEKELCDYIHQVADEKYLYGE